MSTFNFNSFKRLDPLGVLFNSINGTIFQWIFSSSISSLPLWIMDGMNWGGGVEYNVWYLLTSFLQILHFLKLPFSIHNSSLK